jgi:membrane protein YfhO
VLARSTEPRYYFTSSYRLTSAEQALAELPARRSREVLLEHPPAFDPQANAPGDPAVAARTLRNRVVLRLRVPRQGLIYCSESQAPGWRAEVNGRPAPILAANYAFRAVPVPPGEVVVTLSYFPPGLRSGLLISLVAALATVALVLAGDRAPVAGLEAHGRGPSRRVRRALVGFGAAVLLAGALAQAASFYQTASVAPAGAPQIPAQPPSFYRIKWGGVELPAVLPAGGRARLLVSFENAGTETWPDPQMADPVASSPRGAVRLGYRWLDAQSQVVSDYQTRSDLPRPLHPGESITLPIEASIPATPGHYRLQIDLVHELVAWFEPRGAAHFEVPVTVQ